MQATIKTDISEGRLDKEQDELGSILQSKDGSLERWMYEILQCS